MFEGKPTILLSYSVGFQDQVARPVAKALSRFGVRAVLVGDEPLPPGIDSNPNSKIEWFFRHSDMAVFLATPDDHLRSGPINTRLNIIDEHRLGQQQDHLSHRLLVFKAANVTLPSNINPAYEQLPLDDPDWVVRKIVDQARTWGVLPSTAESAADAEPTSSEEGTSGTSTVPLRGKDDSASTDQAIAALKAAIAALNSEQSEGRDLRRAELAIAGLVADQSDSDALGAHLANNLFAERHQIRLRTRELLLLLGTYLRHAPSENAPGVFWIRHLPRKHINQLLLALVRDNGDPVAQIQALSVLSKLGAPAATSDAREMLVPLLASEDAAVCSGALDFIRERCDPRLRDILGAPKLLERNPGRVSQTAAWLDLRRKPSDVMTRYVADGHVRSPEIEDALVGVARRVRQAAVLAALSSPVQDVRLLGLRMANEKAMLAPSQCREIIESDKSARVRIAALRCLVTAGQPVDFALYRVAVDTRDDDISDLTGYNERRSVELDLALLMPAKDLRAHIRWTSAHGPSCYEALGLRDNKWTQRNVRRDLRTGFAALQETERASMITSVIAEIQKKTGSPPTDQEQAVALDIAEKAWTPWSSEEKIGKFTTRLYTRAALRVLAATGRRSDVRFARQYASSPDQDLRIEALRLFGRFGTRSDAAALVKLTDGIYDEALQRDGAESALRLAYKKDKLQVLRDLGEIHPLRSWSVRQLASVAGGTSEAWRLLWSEYAHVRAEAATVVWDAVDPKNAENLLAVYMSGRHFYNVVRAIDHRLYAPDWLADALPTQH